MTVTEVIKHCRPETTLAQAAALMWENNCGVLPVLAENNSAIGIITDSDIAIALGTQKKNANEITVKDAMFGNLFAGSPKDIQIALNIMRKERIQGLPVLNQLHRWMTNAE
ncbi:MAG TPA: CBS domain-containing protein [Blastocatellia bacterium]|nr:CBS domain-containing protein [Blastocatellia bacterium]